MEESEEPDEMEYKYPERPPVESGVWRRDDGTIMAIGDWSLEPMGEDEFSTVDVDWESDER